MKVEYNKGRTAFLEDRHPDTITHFSSCIQMEKDTVYCHVNITVSYIKMEDYESVLWWDLFTRRMDEIFFESNI